MPLRPAPLRSPPGPLPPVRGVNGGRARPRAPTQGPPTAEGCGIAVPRTRPGGHLRAAPLRTAPTAAPPRPGPGGQRSARPGPPTRRGAAAGRAAPSRALCPTSASPARSRGGMRSPALRARPGPGLQLPACPAPPASSSRRAPRRARAGGARGRRRPWRSSAVPPRGASRRRRSGGRSGAVRFGSVRFAPSGIAPLRPPCADAGLPALFQGSRRRPAERRCRFQIPGGPPSRPVSGPTTPQSGRRSAVR